MVLRFLLYPHDLGVLIEFDLGNDALEREWTQLFDSQYGDVIPLHLLSGLLQVVVHLPTAENDSLHLIRGHQLLVLVTDHSLETKSFF